MKGNLQNNSGDVGPILLAERLRHSPEVTKRAMKTQQISTLFLPIAVCYFSTVTRQRWPIDLRRICTVTLRAPAFNSVSVRGVFSAALCKHRGARRGGSKWKQRQEVLHLVFEGWEWERKRCSKNKVLPKLESQCIWEHSCALSQWCGVNLNMAT